MFYPILEADRRSTSGIINGVRRVPGSNGGGASATFVPSDLSGLWSWNRKGPNGITAPGGFVTQWDDASGLGNHLAEATATNQPALQGDGTVIYDGVDNRLMTGAKVLNLPITVCARFRQLSWTAADVIFDGHNISATRVNQTTASPNLQMGAGTVVDNGNLAINTYGSGVFVFDGANSTSLIGGFPASTGNVGGGNPGGFATGVRGGGAASFGHIQVAEWIVYSRALTALEMAQIVDYLDTL